jgi:ribonuclease Z
VGRELHIEAFATEHVVPTLGYHLWRSRRYLAPAFAGSSREELIALRERGVDTSAVAKDLWLSYCADTGPAIFDREPRIFGSKVLMMECTFVGEEHRDKGERFKHLHLGDIAQHADRFQNEAIVLHHLSRRFRVEELRAEVDRRLPDLAPRIHILVEGTAG